MSTAAILLCAGRGERLGGEVPKAAVPLRGRPLFTWPLEALQATAAIDAICVVGPVRVLRDLLSAGGGRNDRIVAWTEGGKERQDSVARGLAALPEDYDYVAVHDCARALVTPEIIGAVVADAMTHGAALAAIPLADTLKRATLQKVDDTVSRAGLWCAQTPQVFKREWLRAAHEAAQAKATDDAALVEALGYPVHLTAADPSNFKITTHSDLALAEACLAARAASTDPARR